MGIKGRTLFRLPHRKMERLPNVPIYSTSIRNIFFDLDDTIIHSQEKYNVATSKCLDLLQREFGFTTEDRRGMRMHLNATDARRALELKKFNINRFTHSWLEIYGEYCKKYNAKQNPETRRQLREISSSAWRAPFVLYDGVLETMKSLKTEFPVSRISILTLGDPIIQNHKIKSLPPEIKNYIDGVFVVENKTPASFARVLGDLNREKCLMVGNSEKSDIYPALAVGIKAVHIPNRGWAGDKHKIDKTDENYTRADNFPQLREILQNL